MASLFEDGELEQYQAGATNPAAPKGMQQASQAAIAYNEQAPGYENSLLGSSLDKYGYAETARTWYTGANIEGEKNGWNTEWAEKFITGQEQAAQSGTLGTYFDSDTATGVVTWDHTSEKDDDVEYTFGDVYEDGKFQGNVMEMFDDDTAAQMMSLWMFDADQLGKIFADGETAPDAEMGKQFPGLVDAVQEQREKNNREFPDMVAAQKLMAQSEARGEDWSGEDGETTGQEIAAIGGAAAGGAALGAGIGAAAGSIVPLAGTAAGGLIGGAIGGIAGGIGGYLNQDAIIEQAARAYEITSLSTREEGLAAGIFTGVSQWSGVAGKAISPLANINQGLVDAAGSSEVGDGDADFHAVDEAGERKVGTVSKVLDIGATLGDAVLQFASPVGAALYMTQMAGTIGGEVGELVATGGETFDYRQGSFDNIFFDDEGNFDPLSGAAGIGKIGIDMVQLGMAKGLVGKANVESSALTGAKPYRLPFGKKPDPDAVTPTIREVGGMRYTVNEAGEATSRRVTASLLAPSEMLPALTAGAIARRARAKTGGAVSADDYYRAANSLANGERKIQNTLVTAFGEGSEEAIQGVLEPLSHNQDLDFREIGMAAAYGAAAGAGMSASVQAKMPSADDRMFAQAQAARYMISGGTEVLTRDEWATYTDVQKRTHASMDRMSKETGTAAAKKVARDQAREQAGGLPAVMKAHDSAQSWIDQASASANDRTDQSFVITQIEDVGTVQADGSQHPDNLPSDAIASSGRQLLRNLNNHQRGFVAQLAKLNKDLKDFDKRIDQALTQPEKDAKRVALERKIAITEQVMEWTQKFNAELDPLIQEMYDDSNDLAGIEADTQVVNELIRKAFHRQIDTFKGETLTDDDKYALARAVSVLFARDPHDQSGSFQILVPQVSARLTAANSDNVLEVSHAILPATGADFDGDKFRQLNQLVMDESEFAAARAGMHFVGAMSGVNINAPVYEEYIVEFLAEAHKSDDPAMQAYVLGTLANIGDTIRSRYTGKIDPLVLDQVLKDFFGQVTKGSKTARAALIDGLAKNAGSQLNEFAQENLSNEWLWIDQIIKTNFNWFQGVYAANRSALSVMDYSEDQAHKQVPADQVRTRRMVAGPTEGQTLAMRTVGSSLFRKFQKLHYTVYNAGVLSSSSKDDAPMDLDEMTALYEELSQKVTRSELDLIRGKDDITDRVYAMLEILSRDVQKLRNEAGVPLTSAQALAVVANMAVMDYSVDAQGNVTPTGARISLTQMLLKQSIAKDRREKDAIFEVSPELQAKHARLRAMTKPNSRPEKGSRDKGQGKVNAERAFVEVVGAQQLYVLLGDQAEIFGPHLTVEQWLRQYQSWSTDKRTRYDREVLMRQPGYRGRKQPKDIPYDFSTVELGDVSAYRAVVDAMIAVGHNRITMDKDGRPIGEYAERSNRTSKNFHEAHTAMRSALQDFMGKRMDGEKKVGQVQRMVEANPDFARRLLNLIPNSAAHAAMQVQPDGSVNIANWVYKILLIEDARKAEMHYWRNLLITEMNAFNANAIIKEEQGEGKDLHYADLPRRMHRLLIDLSRANDGGLQRKRFIDKMEKADNLDDFIAWINTTPGMRGEQAPFTAWVDDTVEFDPDKAKGGWTTSLQGAEQREAIALLRASAVRLHETMSEEKKLWQADVPVLTQIEEEIRTGRTGAGSMYAQVKKALELAGQTMTGVGPNEMITQVVGAARGFYPQAHTKGVNPDYVTPYGQYVAGHDAFDYVVNYSQAMAALHSQNISGVAKNPHMIAKDAGRAMDNDGTVVEWGPFTVEQFISLMKDPETRPGARSIIFPQVMERGPDGNITQQMLHGKSLKHLIDGTTMNTLFQVGKDSRLRYASMVESMSTQLGGDAEFHRAVNEIVISQTSGATRKMSTAAIKSMSVQVAQDVARILQEAAAIEAANTDPDNDPLGEILKTVSAQQKIERAANTFGLERKEQEFLDPILDDYLHEIEAQAIRERNEILARDVEGTSDAESLVFTEMADRVMADLERTKAKIEALRKDDTVAAVKEMFTVPADPQMAAVKKQQIVDYVMGNLTMIQEIPDAREEINRLTQHMRDPKRSAMLPTNVDFDILGRAAMSNYLNMAVAKPAAGVPHALFPDADHESNERYFDSSYTYMLHRILKKDSPLLKAAVQLHKRAGRQGQVSDIDLAGLISRTILDNSKLGPWHPQIPQAIIEANARLDSSSAAPSLSMFGGAPVIEAVVSKATERTYKVPEAAQLSTVTLRSFDLNAADPARRQISVTMPGGEQRVTYMSQMNNRFVSSVMVTIPGEPDPVDLLKVDPNLGQRFLKVKEAAESGYVEINNERLLRALNRVAGTRTDRGDFAIEVTFFHPDSQPSGGEWSNNLFFEGTNFTLNADHFGSLNASLWFSPGGLSPDGQATALQASKKGKPGIRRIKMPTAAERIAAEKSWKLDFASLIRTKTNVLMATDMGFGYLDAAFYNGVYKNVKMRNFVRGIDPDTGQMALWSAEQVIEWQRANPGVTEFPLQNASLWCPSDEVLHSLLGEQGTKGVDRVFPERYFADLELVPSYVGVRPEWLERFPGSVDPNTRPLKKTQVMAQAKMNQLVVRADLTDAEVAQYDARIRYLDSLKTNIHLSRSSHSGFKADVGLEAVLRRAKDTLSAENLSIDGMRAGVPFFGGGRDTSGLVISELLLRDHAKALKADGSRTGWVFREGSEAMPLQGLISQAFLMGGPETKGDKKAFQVAPGDIVLVEVDSFNGDTKLAQQRIDYLMDRGAFVVLGATDGTGNMPYELGEYMTSKNYERVVGSSHLFQPREDSSRNQMTRARASTLTEMRGVSPKDKVLLFHGIGISTTENAAWSTGQEGRLAAARVAMDLVPVDFLADFNIPANPQQIDDVRRHLMGLNNPAGRDMLRTQAHGNLKGAQKKKADKEFKRAWDRLMEQFERNQGSVLPGPGDLFGTGDFIPLINSHGGVLLYKHGYKAPHREAVDTMLMQNTKGRDARNVAIFPSKIEPKATTHEGRVLGFSPRSKFGLQVEMMIPLQQFGDKKQLEWNGMKYLLAPRPSSIHLPDHPFFANGWGVDVISDARSLFDKEATDGLIDDHRNAFAFFGIDFISDVAEFFFPGAGKTEKARHDTMQLLYMIQRGKKIPAEAGQEILTGGRVYQVFKEVLPALEGFDDAANPWKNNLGMPDVSSQIATAVITYLMTDGANVHDIIYSGGFNDPENIDETRESLLMPRMFTQFFDRALPGSDLRVEMNRRFNAQINKGAKDGTGYLIHDDFTVEILNADPTKNMIGWLQFAEIHSSGDNPITNGMTFDEDGRQSVSQHSASIFYQAVGGETAQGTAIEEVRLRGQGKGVTNFASDTVDGGAWEMISNTSRLLKGAASQWRIKTPAETERLRMGHEALVQFRKPIDFDDKELWDDKQRRDYKNLRKSIARQLGLSSKQADTVDFWVRQTLGAPAGQDRQGNELGRISGNEALEAAGDMLWMVENNYLPVVGAEVPLLMVEDLQMIFRANKHREEPWRPKESIDKGRSGTVAQWNDWVTVSLGGALTSDNLFDPMFLLALDGHMHTYLAATESLLDLPVSMDRLVSIGALDPETNKNVNDLSLWDRQGYRYKVSLDPNVDLLASQAVVLDTAHATIEDIIGGKRVAGTYRAVLPPASEISKRRAARRRWRKENGIPIPVEQSMRNFRKNGGDFRNSSTTTSALARGLINLRVAMATINPALYFSMGPEQWVRGVLDRGANLLTGQATIGTAAKVQAAASQALNTSRLAKWADRYGIATVYTPDQLNRLENLYDQLGERNDFKSMVYRQLAYLRPSEAGSSKIGKGLEHAAKFGSQMQDPTYGMRGKTLARRYMEGAMQSIRATPTANILTTDQLVAEMAKNPMFLQQNYPAAHQAGANALAQIRSLKETVWSQMAKGIYEPLSESSNAAVSLLSTVTLKLPLLFSGYAANVFTTITGLQGVEQMLAMFLDGRQKPGFVSKISARMRGDRYEAGKDDRFDMSDVLEGVDLSRTFIRAGLTHTGLFTFGLLAGGLGLGSGEDDETKRRRLLSEAAGVPFIHDPRELENDFRNKDAIFLGDLPIVGDHFDMVHLNWTVKQFVSPIIGFEKFYETGDFSYVTWGFQDALGSFPLINTMMWNDAVETAHALAAAAEKQVKNEGDQGLPAAAALLANAVGVYERMLFENAFVNQLYTSIDRWDRDPYALPLRDSDGDIQRDIEGEPRPNELSLASFIDPETGEMRDGWQSRDTASGALHALTENRATLAFVSSLFTGLPGKSDYWRYNMPIKEREIDRGPMDQADAQALVAAAYAGLASPEVEGEMLPSLTLTEAVSIVRKEISDAGGPYWDTELIETIAKDRIAQEGQGAMSILSANGEEQLTSEGALGIFRGLATGAVQFGDESLRGVHINTPMREQIQEIWQEGLIQEGIDLGLDETKATSRMKRLWFGEYGTDEVGLGEILWSDKISKSDKVTYKQLNTTYVIGPDGFPWATGMARGGNSLFSDIAVAVGLQPLVGQLPAGEGMDLDARRNSVDLFNKINTGLRGLVPLDERSYVPTDVEIGQSIVDAIEKAASQTYPPQTPYSQNKGRGYGGGYGYGGYGGGGGGYYGPRVYFQDMRDLEDIRTPYSNKIPFINSDNPIIRRGDVRRERVWSERGRLKQWQ